MKDVIKKVNEIKLGTESRKEQNRTKEGMDNERTRRRRKMRSKRGNKNKKPVRRNET